MTLIRPLRKIAQALLLAFAAWVFAVGAASAHGGHAHPDDRSVTVMASQFVAHEEPIDATASLSEAMGAPATHQGGGCPGDGPANHAESCCTVACHAAMADEGIDAWAGRGIACPVPMLPRDMLEGRCGERSERPPRIA